MIFYKKSVFYSIALLFSIATTLKSVFCRECESYSSYSSTSLCDDDFNDEKHHKVYIHDLEKIVKTQHIHTQLLQDVISILKKYLITANNGVTNQDIINAINALQRDINRVLKIENQTQDIVQAIYKEIQNVQSTVGEIPELQQSVAQISASQQVQTNMIANLQGRINDLSVTTQLILDLIQSDTNRAMPIKSVNEVSAWLENLQK